MGIIHFTVVEDVYELIRGFYRSNPIVIQLHHGHGDRTSYAYRWSNNTWANWFNYLDDCGLPSEEFWKLTDNYNVRMFEPDAELDGGTVDIIHAYREED